GLGKEQVMEIYGQVATSTAEIRAVQEELAEAAEQLSAGAAAAASQRKIND
ncbi:phosphonate ABC transporter ATP-binding protein, partial [Vibrio vulnificus]